MSLLAASSTSLRWHALPPLWIVVLVIVPLVFLTVRFFYRREAGRIGRRVRIVLGLLRVAAILVVLGALFGPYAETIQGEYLKRHLILCVDTSSSMGIKESYAASPELQAQLREAAGLPPQADLAQQSRLDLVKGVLSKDRGYLAELAQRFHLHLFSFAGSTASLFESRDQEAPAGAAERLLRQVPELRADGSPTRIGATLRDLGRLFRSKNEPVAGILLFTDGRHTGGAPGPLEEAERLAAEGARTPMPVFPVAMGDPASAINIGVSRVDAPEVALAGDEVLFTVTVHARGLKGKQGSLQVFQTVDGQETELPIEPRYFDLPADGDRAKESFRWTFRDPGRYQLRIGVPPMANEAVREDNWQHHILLVVEQKIRVLMVASKPNYTYRFLGPALTREGGMIEAQLLLLNADPERPQEVTRGLPPLTVFPQEKRELAQYHVILFMDVDPSDPRISPDGEEGRERVLAMLENWVKQGGGLILEAGRDGNIPYGYTYPPLNALLPVVPAAMSQVRRDAVIDLPARKRFWLTPAGKTHPIMRVLRDPEQVEEFWNTDDYAAEYYWYAPVERAKSSATVLAVRREEGERGPGEHKDPLIAIQDYGLGKVLYIGTDELWRMRRFVENLYYWAFWSNSIRNLATYGLLSGNKRIKIWVDRADRRYQVGDQIGVEAKFLDENFEPVEPREGDAASLVRHLKLRAPDGTEEEITLQAAGDDAPGIFRAKLPAGRPGTYSLVAEPLEGDQDVAETTFVIEETTVETSDPLLDLHTLEGIAERTGGAVLWPHEFGTLLKDERVPQTGIKRSGEPQRTDLWDRGWVLLLVVALLAAEWILRRLNLLL